MTLTLFLVLAVCFLAYSNGANDNFKGVATLFGSDTTNYKRAIAWATVTTFAGSVSSIFLAATLVKTFSGKGLVPDAIAGSPLFLLAVALGASLTVMAAALKGFPISTTHSLTGALVGAGLVAAGSNVNFEQLGKAFFLPLIASPFIALALAALAYVIFRAVRLYLGITKEWCLCVGEKQQVLATATLPGTINMKAIIAPELTIDLDLQDNCTQRYRGHILGINCQSMLDAAHFLSAGLVSFARGLNDTPKIVGLLLAVEALRIEYGMIAIALAMALGGLLNARKVAHTMSKKITTMNHGQGFTANLVTGFLVIVASRLGVPVSTTHVSVGSLFGIGAVTGKINTKVASGIVLSWVLTLPVAAFFAAAAYWLVGLIGL